MLSSWVVFRQVYILIHNGSMYSEWVRTWDFLTHGRAVQEIGGSNSGRGTIAGGVFHPTRQLARFSPLNMQYIVNSK